MLEKKEGQVPVRISILVFCFQDSLQYFQFWHARRDLFFALYPRGYQPEEMWV
jgi:hypothetical protein